MDVMQIRRMLMSTIGGGNMAQAKSGTFTGDGTIDVALNVGFEPDVIVIDSGINFDVAGARGILGVYIAKGIFTLNFYHNSDTDTNERIYSRRLKTTDNEWGNNTAAYRSYATYSNGTLTVSNNTTNDNVIFINGQTYSWTAYKA